MVTDRSLLVAKSTVKTEPSPVMSGAYSFATRHAPGDLATENAEYSVRCNGSEDAPAAFLVLLSSGQRLTHPV